MDTFNFLNEPYPYYYHLRSIGTIALVVFAFTFLFYFLLQPFDVNVDEHYYNFFWISIIHAIPSTIIILIQGLLTSKLIKRTDQWTVKQEFIFFSFFLLFVGIAQFLIRDLIYINAENWSMKYLLEEVRNTFLVGGVFIIISVPLNFYRMKAGNSKRASSLPNYSAIETPKKILSLSTKVKSEAFNLNLDDFLFARSEGNYLVFIIKKGTQTKKVLKRLSINDLMSQISVQDNIIQSHRSYVINIDSIDRITGNAAGFKIFFRYGEETALVSRNRIKLFEQRLKELKK
jgi:hypothetical protein